MVNINEIYDVKRSSILYPKDVSHNNFEPRTKFPIVIWKYVLPDDQFDILVNGCVTNISCKIKIVYYVGLIGMYIKKNSWGACHAKITEVIEV